MVPSASAAIMVVSHHHKALHLDSPHRLLVVSLLALTDLQLVVPHHPPEVVLEALNKEVVMCMVMATDMVLVGMGMGVVIMRREGLLDFPVKR